MSKGKSDILGVEKKFLYNPFNNREKWYENYFWFRKGKFFNPFGNIEIWDIGEGSEFGIENFYKKPICIVIKGLQILLE